MAFPSFLLSLATVGILGQGMSNMIVAIVIIEWIYYARSVTNLVIFTEARALWWLVLRSWEWGSFHYPSKSIFLPFIYNANTGDSSNEHREYHS